MFDFKKLLEFEYFPVELPECFTSKDIVDSYGEIEGQITATSYRKSVPFLFSVYKNEKTRRRMALPNIYHYIKIVKILCENETELIKIYNLSKYSLTKPSKNQKNTERRAYNRESNNTYETRKRNEELFQDNTLCIKLDISNFFDSIYTHSIAWAIHTKSIAKQNKNNMALLGNKIDNCLQGLNDRQTHGILVGNAVSRLISEIILCKIDDEIRTEFPKVDMCRFVDDYAFYIAGGANQTYSPDSIITFVRNRLLEYDLLLNETKTKIIKAPFVLGQNGIDELRSVVLCDPYDYYNRMIVIYNKYEDSSLFKYGLKVLYCKINRDNINEICPLLINLWVRFPSLANCILPILFKNRDSITGKQRKILFKAIKTIIFNGISYRQEVEVVWAIWTMICFEFKITENVLRSICTSNNDFSIIMALSYLQKDNEIFYQRELRKLENTIIQDVNNECDVTDNEVRILTSHWLLIYELVRKNITSNSTIISYVKDNRFFKKLLDLDVDFYKPTEDIIKNMTKSEDDNTKEKRIREIVKDIIQIKSDNENYDDKLDEISEWIYKSSRWDY